MSQVLDLAASQGSGYAEIDLSWTTPADCLDLGENNFQVFIRRSFSEIITEQDWEDAEYIYSGVVGAGSQSYTVTNNPCGTSYFAIRFMDDVNGTLGDISNSPYSEPNLTLGLLDMSGTAVSVTRDWDTDIYGTPIVVPLYGPVGSQKYYLRCTNTIVVAPTYECLPADMELVITFNGLDYTYHDYPVGLQIDTTALEDGNYTLEWKFVTYYGEIGETNYGGDTLSLYIDNTKPTIGSISATYGASWNMGCTVDDDGGVFYVCTELISPISYLSKMRGGLPVFYYSNNPNDSWEFGPTISTSYNYIDTGTVDDTDYCNMSSVIIVINAWDLAGNRTQTYQIVAVTGGTPSVPGNCCALISSNIITESSYQITVDYSSLIETVDDYFINPVLDGLDAYISNVEIDTEEEEIYLTFIPTECIGLKVVMFLNAMGGDGGITDVKRICINVLIDLSDCAPCTMTLFDFPETGETTTDTSG